MNRLAVSGAATVDSLRFSSLAELKSTHGDLLEKYRAAADGRASDGSAFESSLDEAVEFMRRARSTGSLLGSDGDREAGPSGWWITGPRS